MSDHETPETAASYAQVLRWLREPGTCATVYVTSLNRDMPVSKASVIEAIQEKIAHNDEEMIDAWGREFLVFRYEWGQIRIT